MALQHLSEEQVRTWTLEQKDRWWRANVFRGDTPQLTLRAALTGFVLGGFLSATNLYVGARTGITLGVGLTSVILAFGMFKLFASLGMKDMSILENNCMQSIATAAGYMTMPLMSSITAYMWMTDRVVPAYQMLLWNVLLSLMGVLVAFPMKRRFINDEQQPFPEGRACGVVLDTLYNSASQAAGMLQTKALAFAGAIAATIQFFTGHAYQTYLQCKLLGFETAIAIPEKLDEWYYALCKKHNWTTPTIAGVDLRELALRPSLDLAMIGAGGLMGPKITTSLMVGMVINFVILAPWMINIGDIQPRAGSVADGTAVYGRAHIVNTWAIWWGVGIMVVGSLVALFAKPKVIFGAFAGLFSRRDKTADVLGDVELPLWISFAGVPLLAAVSAWMGAEFFGVKWYYVLLSLPLVLALSLICTNAMALTSWTPTGALSKITQFTFGAIDRSNPATNLMTAGVTSEVASNAANLLSDIKPGYMLGAKPRQQAIGHAIGILSGAIASTPLFFAMFLNKVPEKLGKGELMAAMTPEGSPYAFPGAVQWKGVADIIARGFDFANLPMSIQWSLAIAALAAVVFEVARIATRGRFPLSAVSIGLGVVLPPDATLAMWVGSLFFWWMGRNRTPGSTGHKLWVESQESICAGIIAGAAIIGIGDKLTEVFLLG
ncbi:MAG: OPT/YSL family transporter [Planctomycetes bacterium]|nr:OPT/YSL family transporter [Planctomycetota bacterium]